MNTIIYALGSVIPPSRHATGIHFVQLEMMQSEYSPLAVVWYTVDGEAELRGARIDLQKRAFLDDFGPNDRSGFGAEARLIVDFLNSDAGSAMAAAARASMHSQAVG